MAVRPLSSPLQAGIVLVLKEADDASIGGTHMAGAIGRLATGVIARKSA